MVARVLLQAPQLLALDIELVLAQLVLGERRPVGIDDHHALRAVDDQQLVLADQLARAKCSATIDGMLRLRATTAVCEVDAAEIGDEARELVPLELHDVGGR